MRLRGRRRSTRIDDRRGRPPRGGRGVKLGGVGIVLVLVAAWLLGLDPREVLQVAETVQQPATGVGGGAPPRSPADDAATVFVQQVVGTTEDVWIEVFARMGRAYTPPTVTLFDDRVDSACGTTSSAVGPFYCPADGHVYLDLTFFHALDRRFGAPGDFAQAYVIAHEVGHHVQQQLGISEAVSRRRAVATPVEKNRLSVLIELQADCLAGVWGHRANRLPGGPILEPGDVEEGLQAAAAIGDDTLQRRAGGRVTPETWTHGSSADRVTWFRTGLETGDVQACDSVGLSRR